MGRAQFVGRRGELGAAHSRLRTAADGTGQVVLVYGEPGIGKTRLAQEIAELATSDGMPVCWGRAVKDEGSPPYWPFRQVVRELVGRHAAGELAKDLAVVAPEVGPTRPVTTPEERFRVFEAVTEYLTTAAGQDGLLVVLDDLHWADPPTLQLLVHLARAVRSSRLMVMATYRDTETRGREALTSALASLTHDVTRVRLVGLTVSEVATQLAGLTGAPVAEHVAATVSRRTQGNPFFVAELGRLLHDNGASLPDAVRDAIRARLDALSPLCRDVVAAASVLGSQLDPAVLADVLDRSLDDVLAALDEAASAGVTDGWRFSHDLIRDTARLIMPTAARLSLHRRIAAHFEARSDAGTRAAEIAHHWLESLPAGDLVKAAEWAERAADTAMAQLAWENAADLYARALRASPDLSASARSRLLCRQGSAQLRQFDVVGGETTLGLAAQAAREAGDPRAIAEVALAMETVSSAEWINTGKALCDEALAVLPPQDDPLRARLLAQRVAEAAFVGASGLDDLSEEALAMADRTGDPLALRSALRARQLARSGPEGVHDRLAVADRMYAIGVADDDPDALLWGRLWRFDAFCQLGRLDEAEAELLPISEAAARVRTGIARWHLLRSRAPLALARGRFKEAREQAEAAIDLVKDSGGPVLEAISISILAAVAGMTGQDEEVVERYSDYLLNPPEIIAPLLGAWNAECGRLDVARRCYQPAQVYQPIASVRRMSVLAGFVVLADAFDDREAAAEAYRLLLPHSDLIVCGGAGQVVIHGSAHRFLGMAAATLGRLDDAVRHFRAGIQTDERTGMIPFAATGRLGLARVLARRRRPGDAAESEALATSAAATAEQLGMVPLLRAARELSTSASGTLSKREHEIAILVAQGLTNKQIAATTHISVRTVESHVQSILGKLGVATRTQIATWAASQR
jgi:DNA-binding CsgD family transcriptional regulator/tetratricopeptide (TPR) repeat protein